MSNEQDENENNSTDQMSHHRTEENDGTRENNVSSTSSYASVSENRNKSMKRKNTNESGSFYKRTCFEATGSNTAGKHIMNSEDYKMMAPMENQNLSLTVKNFFENYLLQQERLCKDVIQGAKNQQNSESTFSGSIYSQQSPSPFQENKITNRGENFDLSTSKATQANLDENTRVNDFRGNFLYEDDKWNNDQDVNNHKSTDKISNLGTGENDRNQVNIVSAMSSYESTPEKRNEPMKRKNKSDDFCKKICYEVNESGTTGKQMHSEESLEHWNEDMEWNCEESTYSENGIKFQECSFKEAHGSENLPSHHMLHPTSIISELPNEISKSLNQTNNINKTEDIEDQSQRAFISEVLRDNLRKSNIEFLILPSTSAYQCIENNESFTISIKDMILINEVKKFTGTEVEHENKVNNTSSITLGAPHEMRINNNEKQTLLPTDDVSYLNVNNGKTFILNEDELPNDHSEMEELRMDDTEEFNFRISDVEDRYQEVISLDEINCNRALKLNEETYSPYRQSIFSEQDNVSPTAIFKLNSTNKYNQTIDKSEEKDTYLESIISTGPGTPCDQAKKPMILQESTDRCINTPDKEYSSCLLNPDYLENITRSRDSIIINNLEVNGTNHLEEFEIEQLENNNHKILISETFQLNEFETGFETSGDIIMPIHGISEQNNVPTAIRQKATAQSFPNLLNANFSGSSSTRAEIQGGISTEDIRIEPTMTNTKLPSTNIPDVVPESCIDLLMTRPEVPQNVSNLQSCTNVTRKSTKVKKNRETMNIKENKDECKFIINKLTLEYIENKTLEEFTIHDIVKFVMAHNSSLPFINVLQSIRSSLEDYTKTGTLKFKTNGKYKIICDSTHQSFATGSKKERTGIEKSSNRNHRSKQNIENNQQDAINSIQASTSHLTALNDSIL